MCEWECSVEEVSSIILAVSYRRYIRCKMCNEGKFDKTITQHRWHLFLSSLRRVSDVRPTASEWPHCTVLSLLRFTVGFVDCSELLDRV